MFKKQHILKQHLNSICFYAFLTLLLIAEGWGLPSGRINAFHIILFVPLVLFGIHSMTQKKIRIPRVLFTISLLFITTIFATTIFSVNIQQSFEYRLLYTSLFLVGIFVYNHQAEIKKQFPQFLLYASFGTLVLTGILFIVSFFNIFVPLVDHGYQFVLINNKLSHYSFGAFVIIPLVFVSIHLMHKWRIHTLLISLVLLLILFLSWLRASYAGLVGVLSFFLATTRASYKKTPSIIVLIFLGTTILLFAIATIFSTYTATNSIYSMKPDTRKIQSLQTRIQYAKQSFQSIYQHPLTGIGTYNYIYASRQFAESHNEIQNSSHNLLLDIAVENGLVSLILFIGILSLLFKRGLNIHELTLVEKGIFGIYLALFIVFQFSHYHRVYFLFTFFLACAFLLYKEKRELIVSIKTLIIISAVIALANLLIIISTISLKKGNFELAATLYPLHSLAQQSYIASSFQENNISVVKNKLAMYERLYAHEPAAQDFTGTMYSLLGEKEVALMHYEKALSLFPQQTDTLKNIYELKKELDGEEIAKQFVSDYIDEHNLFKNNPSWEFFPFRDWCIENSIKYDDK